MELKEIEMAALPKQVEQDLKELEEYEKSMAPSAEVNEPEGTPEPAPTTPATQPLAAVPETPVVPEETWEHKYQTLLGKYNAEVPRLHAQNKEAVASIQALRETVEGMKASSAPAPSAPTSLVTEQDVSDYGQDLIDVQRRVATEVMAPLKAELALRDAKIAELEKAQKKTVDVVTTSTFENQLSRAIPDFEQINADPKWIAWLDEVDPYTQEPRRAFAEFVYNNGDVVKLKRIVEFFKGSVPSAPAATDERQQRQAELERQITPTRTTSTVQSTSPVNSTIYTEAQVAKLFDDVRRMNIAGKYDDASKLEAELSDAYTQGRVRG